MNSKPPLRIFIAEDSAELIQVLRIYLESLGHQVDAATTGEEALKACGAADYDMLISDIELPGINGWEFMGLLGNRRPAYALAMSALDSDEDRQRSQDAGFRHHLVKPFSPFVLALLLEEAAREKLSAASAASKATVRWQQMASAE